MTPIKLNQYSDFEDAIFVECNAGARILEIWNKFDDKLNLSPLDFNIRPHIIEKINEEAKRKHQRNGG